jgi:hypothetical protein
MRLRWVMVVAGLALTAGCLENECAECRDEKCSDLVSYCRDDAGCGCMADCLGDEGIPGVEGCLSVCGLTERPSAFVLVEECVAVACPDTDECNTPRNYTPPEQLSAGGEPGDISGGDLPDCAFDPDLAHRPDSGELQLRSADGEVCVHIRRDNKGAGNLANTRWELDEIWVGPAGGVAQVSNAEDLCWYSSHHNFRDLAHVWTGRRRHAVQLLEDGHGGARKYSLYTFETGPLVGGCPPLPEGGNPIGDVIELLPLTP